MEEQPVDVEEQLVAALGEQRRKRGTATTIIVIAIEEVQRLKKELAESREAHGSTLIRLSEVNDELGELKDASAK